MSVTSHNPDDFDDDAPLYEAAPKVYPQKVSGTYRRIKTIILIVALGIYYFMPFLRWDRGTNAPSQAVLVDLPGRRFYFFFLEIWPQEVYYLTGLLIMAALILFLMNALAGRIWCGYFCPQTVWTDLFLMIERLTEGDRRERMANDAGPWTAKLVARKTVKHILWLMVAWWTGGAWVLYFADAPTLVWQLMTFSAPMQAYIWIGILTCTTYGLAGHMREQVCLYMCPWPRIQAAMTDENALNVTYRSDRGEPRISVKKAAVLRAAGQPAGDCVDCNQCVAVCPTGVDIRQGANLGCIGCGLCIDACDSVMTRLKRKPRLIAYDTDENIKRHKEGKPSVYKFVRARTILYVVLILLVIGLMATALINHRDESVAVIHDRNPIYVTLSSGDIRNAYTVRIINRNPQARTFTLTISGLENAELTVIGEKDKGSSTIAVAADQTEEVRVLVTTKGKPAAPSTPLTFKIKSGNDAVEVKDFFKGP